jgi:predicted cupin superfamily sugar epimerase
MTADDVIAALDLAPHPEGGWYRETYRHVGAAGARGAGTVIYYLLRAGERSAWHRVTDADEIWHWYAGASLELRIAADGHAARTAVLGPTVTEGERPQGLVPANAWQAARSLGDWTLVGCTVAPAFDFASFEMAPPGWEPD